MNRSATRYIRVALSLAGSAILLYACDGGASDGRADSAETMMTEYSEDLSIVESQNGMRSYHFETPLVEGYMLAREPYREFRRGIRITTFRKDSLASVDAVLTANYAIYYENRKLWEAKGDVVVRKWDGKELYTQQLFWNERTKRIYSNVDSRFVDGTRGVFVGEGFESDDQFDDWQLRYQRSRMEVEMKEGEATDSAAAAKPGATDSPAATPAGSADPGPDLGTGPGERSPAAETSRRETPSLRDDGGAAAAGERPIRSGRAAGRRTASSVQIGRRPAPDSVAASAVRRRRATAVDTLQTNP